MKLLNKNNITPEAIKQKANELGLNKIGIARAQNLEVEREKLNKWIDKGSNASMSWLASRRDERGNIYNYFPEVKSVISVGLNYYVGLSQNDLKSDYKFSNYAWGEDYHLILKSKLFELLNWIKNTKSDVKGLVCVDTAPIMEKVWAQKAGIGWIGKHTNLITKDFGSWIFLGEILLDFEIDEDPMFDEDLCGTCTACIDSCPTKALKEYELDAGKCISYLSIEHRGKFDSDNSDLYNWIYGCDICQEVCPWNIKFSTKSQFEDFYPRKEIQNFNNEDWEKLNKKQYQKIFKKSSVKRTKYEGLKRNIQNDKF